MSKLIINSLSRDRDRKNSRVDKRKYSKHPSASVLSAQLLLFPISTASEVLGIAASVKSL